LQECDDTFVN